MKSEVRRSSRRLTPEKVARLRQVREQVEAEKDDIMGQAEQAFTAHEQAIGKTIGELKSLREARGITVQEREIMGFHRFFSIPSHHFFATGGFTPVSHPQLQFPRQVVGH